MLSQRELLHEFSNHMIRRQRVPTALISVTVRPVEALYRALEKCYASQEDPEEIWIAIIFVPDDANTKPHHARELAQQLMDNKDANAFRYEYLFEREIPRSYLEHNVSLKELIKRGLSDGMFLDAERSFPGTLEEFRRVIMSAILLDAYDAGRWLGGISRAFGAGAPVYEIANKIFSDSLGNFRHIDQNHQYVNVYWANDQGDLEFHGGIEFGSICDIENGIRDKLDSWLDI
ncbi:hypothetical protein N7449_000541 [Penicillium cf. viridicatum]|uniref:DUF7587 domain-containing protein n=1 Tax=Penicillium cf. viridicatum TaxID=2972119 RepID=A0A9W9N523_9EURO|nr:hypothetical protein N7449_000541 [Penicillium cf. viridicatum]